MLSLHGVRPPAVTREALPRKSPASSAFLHYQNEVGEEFIPKIKNEDFAKYWLVRGPISNKVFKIKVF